MLSLICVKVERASSLADGRCEKVGRRRFTLGASTTGVSSFVDTDKVTSSILISISSALTLTATSPSDCVLKAPWSPFALVEERPMVGMDAKVKSKSGLEDEDP